MRRRGAILGLLALVLAGAGWWIVGAQPQPEERRAGPGDVYLALGDSLAAGVLLSQPEEAYVARIGAALQARAPIVTHNLAVPGATSATLLRQQLPQALALIHAEQQAGRRVSPITIDIGGNDALAVRHAPAVERQRMLAQVEANLGALLDQLIAATSHQGRREANIAVMTYYNPFPGDAGDPTSEAYWSARLNETIMRVAQARQVAVADIRAAFAGGNVYRYTYIAAGDVHANADGHALIAAAFLEALGYTQTTGFSAGRE
ncbi:SGNH/GDSL hydrolase family protein [Kallotenue papyrolyticum]|uniref:SGNH/GDSL hydrolase family protein n=1 Tax=Kallotenue papyrolyticum TaxID=1325125 RepID=UPI000472CEEB|nr:SGNH/GDSL hydrolase family protein [Kallotenue papyrolyticum]